MKDFSLALAAPMLSALSIIVCEPSPAAAISVELANKCRDMAIKSHPPPSPLGNRAYAQAERISSARVSQKKVKCQTAMRRQIRNRAESAF